MRLIGLSMAVISCIYFAIIKLNQAKYHIDTLQKAYTCVQLIRNELAVNPDVLREVFLRIIHRNHEEINIFFVELCNELDNLENKTFHSIWCASVRKHFSLLSEEQQTELARLGDSLGRCHVDMQLSALKRCEEYLWSCLCEKKREFPQNCKLYLGLSAAAGTLLFIVLI